MLTMSRSAFDIIVFVVRKPGTGSKKSLSLTKKAGERSPVTALVRHVTVSGAGLRLELALELLLAESPERPAGDGDGA